MPKKPSGRPPKLNDISYLEAVKAFQKFGYQVVRQSGSHIIMAKHGVLLHVTIPAHRPIREGTLRSVLKGAGLSPEAFAELLG